MTYRIVVGTLLLAVGGSHVTVRAQSFSPPTGPLYQERIQKEAYFEQLRTTMSEEEFYEEGGE